MIIQSLTNPKIKHIVHLHTRSYRQTHGQFLAQGLTACITLMEANCELDSIYLTEKQYLAHGDSFPTERITIVTEEVMKKISTTITPSGIVGIFVTPQAANQATSNAIALYNIQDPGNLGTLIRTAAALNIEAVYLIEGVDPYNPKVIQATAGTIANVKILQLTWPEFETLRGNLETCALIVRNGQNPNKINLKRTILIIGNEAQGLPEAVIDQSSHQMTIPMPGSTESLNAAVAGSIAMYLKTADYNA